MKEEQTINRLPKGWQELKLSEIGKVINGDRGKNYPSRAHYAESGVPFISAGNIEENLIDSDNLNYITNEKFESLNSGKLRKGDIIYCLRGSLGKCAIFNFEQGAISSSLCILRLDTNVLDKFAYYYLCSPHGRGEILKYDNGTAQPNLSAKNFANYKIFVPPFEEQKATVSKIEELFSEIDKGIEELKTVQQQLKVYRQAVLKWAFEGKLTNEDVKEGELPNGWKWEKVADVADKVFDGPFGSHLKTDDYIIQGVRVIRLENIGVLEFRDEYKTYVSNEKFATINKHEVSGGDIIFSSFIIGEIRVVVLPEFIKKAINKADCFCIRVNANKVDRHFLAYFLSTKNVYNQLVKEVHGATRPRINTTQLKACVVPLCSIEEQQKIVQEIESRLSVCDKIEETVTNSLKQAEALRQSILKKAFEGKLVIDEKPQAKVIPIERKALACWIINLNYDHKYFGLTKFQKDLYLCEQFAEVEYETWYGQRRAGPYDEEFTLAFRKEMVEKDWFQEETKYTMTHFVPGNHAGELSKEYAKSFRRKSQKIQFVLKVMKEKTLHEAELIATLYAVWNNRILRKQIIDDDSLIEDIYSWSSEKVKYSKEEIITMLKWMSEISLVPVGFGKVI